MIYFDNAASSYPKPPNVAKEMYKWIRNNGANPGRSAHRPSIEASELVYETRNRIAEFFGVSDVSKIAFVPNATFGLNMIIQGVIKPYDHVITTNLEHNSVLRPLQLMKYKGVNVDVVDVDMYDDDKTIDNILSKINSNTTAIICTQCSNVCGKVLPIFKLSKQKPNDIKLIVDGSQGAGVIPTNLENLGIDYYCAPSHKGLMGPQGSGFVAACSDLPMPVIVGGTGSESFDLNQPNYMPDLLESGTISTPSICGLNEGIKYINNVGIETIYKHKVNLVKYIYDKLKSIDEIINYIDVDKSLFVGVYSFNVRGVSSDDFASYLADNNVCVRGGFHCAPLFHKKMLTENVGMVRLSFGNYNSYQEIDSFIKILNKYLKK